MKIPRAYFRVIEHELYHYDDTLLELEQLKEEHREESPAAMDERPNIQRCAVGDPTYAKVSKMLTNSCVIHMERTIRAIDRALVQLDEVHNDIFELKYRQGKHWRQILILAHLGQDAYFRRRRELIQQVAMNMGYTGIAK